MLRSPVCRQWKLGVAVDAPELGKGLRAERNYYNSKVACYYQALTC